MKRSKPVFLLSAILLIVSCNTNYRVVTTVSGNGNAHREVYAKADSAFIAGDLSKNPYYFDISKGWKIVKLDSMYTFNLFGEEKQMNVKVVSEGPSIEYFSKNIKFKEQMRSFAIPNETITKKRGWFYPVYTFKCVYKKLGHNLPVSIDEYLTKDEQKLWSQGGFENFGELNGSEMNDFLRGIEKRVIEWYAKNSFEISYAAINKFNFEKPLSDSLKNDVFNIIKSKYKEDEIDPQKVASELDRKLGTDYYSRLYGMNKEPIDNNYEKGIEVIPLLGYLISYEIRLPGKIIDANTSNIKNGVIIWKVDGARLMFDNYTLVAEYRRINIWAFIISGVTLLLALLSLSYIIKKRVKR